MKNTRKGFTLVELLVVIAIIAILITVATMGYSSFIDKSNQSVDFQLVTQMNIALTASSVESRPVYPNDVRNILRGAGFDLATQLDPTYEDYYFIWDKDNNVIVIVDESKGEIVFPEDFEGTTFTRDMIDGAHYFDIDMPSADIRIEEPCIVEDVFLAGGGTADVELEALYTFIAEETLDPEYKDYYADFVVSADNNVQNVGLFGYYESFGLWAGAYSGYLDQDDAQNIPLLLGAMGMTMTYEAIQSEVREFKCGVSDPEEDETFTITVKLCLFEDYDEEAHAYVGETIVLNEVTYTFGTNR